MILFPFYYAAGFSIISKILRRESEIYLIRILAYAIITNSLIILLLIIFKDLNPPFHQFIHITPKNYKYVYEVPLNIRHSGLGVSGFSYLSFKTVCLYFIILFYSYQKRDIKNYFIHITSVVVILSLIFVARTGLFLGIFGYAIYLFLSNKKIFITLTIVLFIVFSSAVNFYLDDNGGSLIPAIERSFDLFFSEKNNGAIEELSYEANSYKINNFFLGEGDYGRDRGLISDIGFISFLNGGGILGLFILIMHWFLILIKTFPYTNNWVKRGLFYVAILLLIFNSKELVFYGHGYMQAMIILMIFYEQKRHYCYDDSI